MTACARGRFKEHLKRVCLVVATATSLPANAASIFDNGKGVSIGGALVAKPATGRGSPPAYQLQPDRWSNELSHVKGAGFGFIRLIATPVPLMTSDADALGHALSSLGGLVDQANAAGLAVILDLHFWSSDAPLDQDTVAPDPALRAALVRGEAAVARMLAGRRGSRVALEVLNEPRCDAPGGGEWATLQRTIVAEIRKVAPTLPLVLTACRGSLDRLARFDPTPYSRDAAIYWTFHYYDPGVFVDQEGTGLRSVPFPPDRALADSPAAVAAMSAGTHAATRRRTLADLDSYLRHHHGQATIGEQFETAAAWARRYGISLRHIYVGEFATLMSQNPTSEKIRADQLRWIAAVREEAERRGYSWCYWGIPSATSINYDPRTHFFRIDALAALGLATPH
jgi:hypothetical protein